MLANVILLQLGEHRHNPAFHDLAYEYYGAWAQLPSYFALGLVTGVVSVGFVKLIYLAEDLSHRWLPSWWRRAIVLGLVLGLCGILYPLEPPTRSAGRRLRGSTRRRVDPAPAGGR